MSQLDIVLKKLCTCLGKENILSKKVDLAAYRDSVHLSGRSPSAVIFPQDTAKVSEALKILNHYQIPCIPRGAGTNLCGDTLSFGPTVIMEMAKMDRILEVNILDRYIAVEPGVPNSTVQKALAPHGYFFAPDPASFGVSTIGGNIGENAGGMRCVKYGVTSDNVIGLEIVLSDGRMIRHKGPFPDDGGYNLTGLVHGSEGTFGVITKAWLRMVKLPEEVKTMVAVFSTLEDSVETVSRIIGRGMIPSALEIIDHLAIQALEETRPMGYPINAEAVLLIEVDGFAGTLEAQVERIKAICQGNHVSEVRIAQTEAERQLLWLGRREALNCFVSKRPTYAQEDVAVPRARLPEMLNIIKGISRKYSLVVASVCHAGDGNFHPTIIYDDKDEDETNRAHMAFSEMMGQAVALGGTITGEHGIGVEKLKGMELLFSAEELDFMERVKLAFDPKKILNPGKVISDKVRESSEEKTEQVVNELNKEAFLHSLVRENIAYFSDISGILIKPKSSMDVAKIVKLAGAYQLKISPLGKGEAASLVSCGTCDAVIDMHNLNKVMEIDGENLTVTVEG
ncbi:MAG: FAD-linked oxidase C-terminal domain-containing protein, partial [Dehalobacterium sp.]